ncbi:protein of unknown function [Cupriavidus taiwanensis]|nr:protein of unknown function [Cupriavidus taiwanensis]
MPPLRQCGHEAAGVRRSARMLVPFNYPLSFPRRRESSFF